ncbi:hypothetical protein [Kitasatospora sp. NPDC087315]|uniref:hypothetical protein n=1 Tax=Kitasatospora sp. NPDC087315 TaxID=3364069 RepID=UPI003825A39A
MPLQDRLREGLPTAGQLPSEFQLLTDETDSATAGTPASGAPIASVPCPGLSPGHFLTARARPLEDVAVGLEKPSADADGFGWFGQESLDRYAPGQAAAVLAAIRSTAQRCASCTDTLPVGVPRR